MAGSQLKRLKASLREQGIIGPQQSKKQKKKNAQDAQARNDKRVQRSAALEGIREQFNPFQFKMNARGPKFEVTRDRPQTKEAARGIKGRPGVANSVAEERVSFTLGDDPANFMLTQRNSAVKLYWSICSGGTKSVVSSIAVSARTTRQ